MNINVVCLVIKGKEKRKLLHFLLSLLCNYCFLELLLKAKESVRVELHLITWHQPKLPHQEYACSKAVPHKQ